MKSKPDRLFIHPSGGCADSSCKLLSSGFTALGFSEWFAGLLALMPTWRGAFEIGYVVTALSGILRKIAQNFLCIGNQRSWGYNGNAVECKEQ